jgi:hypothetical protein
VRDDRPARAHVWIAAYAASFAAQCSTLEKAAEVAGSPAKASDVAAVAAAVATLAGEEFDKLQETAKRRRRGRCYRCGAVDVVVVKDRFRCTVCRGPATSAAWMADDPQESPEKAHIVTGGVTHG